MSEEETKRTTLNDFEPIQKIGEGSFSTVYKVLKTSNQKFYALKKVKLSCLSERERNNSLNEVRLLASIESPFIIQYKQAFLDQNLNLLCIVMEWASDGDLQKMIAKQECQQYFDEAFIWKAIIHILQGLQLLHSKEVLHRDLKTANIFISDGVFKIGDMNVSKVQSQQKLAYTQTGTPYYASPEIWRDEPYDSRSDIWSFGCIIYEMCCFHPPFQGKDLQGLYKLIKKGKYEAIPSIYSKQLFNLINSCLKPKAKDRPSANQMLYGLNGLICKKKREHNINAGKNTHSLKLLNTLIYSNDLTQISNKLPQSRYQKQTKYKNLTEETFQRSDQQLNSPHKLNKLSPTSLEKTDTRQDSDKKLKKIRKCHLKISRKISKFLKLSAEVSQLRQDSRLVPIVKIQSLKQIQLNQDSQINHQNYSQRSSKQQIQKNKRITTERRHQILEEPPAFKDLQIIKELRIKLQNKKNKEKKINSSSEVNNLKLQSKKYSLNKDQSNSKLKIKHSNYSEQKVHLPTKDRQQRAFVDHLRKMSKKQGIKKSSSIPTLTKGNKLIKIDDQILKVDAILQDQNHSKRVFYLKKRSKNFNMPKIPC